MSKWHKIGRHSQHAPMPIPPPFHHDVMTPSRPLYSVDQLRGIERSALSVLPSYTLMQRAGQAAAFKAFELLGSQSHGKALLVLAGPGNNGGDALEAACHLSRRGCIITVLHFADAQKLPADAACAYDRAKKAGMQFADTAAWRDVIDSNQWSLIIDGLFGIGMRRTIDEELRAVVDTVNTLSCPLLALDVPSGLDADTGNVSGGIAIRATHTITFIGDKPGLHTCDGRDYAGEITVADLHIDRALLPAPTAWLSAPDMFAGSLHARRHGSHKGSYGDCIVIGGAQGMSGAAILAARAAAKCGAGRVFAAFLCSPPAYDPMHPELMCRLAREMPLARGALVVGTGLGVSPDAHKIVAKALHADAPLVFDADALNLIAQDTGLQTMLRARGKPTLLTPHPLEAARLLAWSTAQVQADRMAAGRELAARFNAIVALKGSGTVIAQPDGSIAINPTGNPALATGGTGDVLAGICGALLAQGWSATHAALGAVWLHGHAADELVRQGTGPIGLVASELIVEVRRALNTLTEQFRRPRVAP